MSSQIISPIPTTPRRSNLHILTYPDLFASLDATLAAASKQSGDDTLGDLPIYAIPEHDYTVPAPPPPSPVSFRADHFSLNTSGITAGHH